MVNVEARSLDAKVVTRRCVLAKLKELTIEKYRDIVSQSAGGILVLLPNNLAALPQEEQEVRSRVPTHPGKPGKMRVHLENLEISWNFEKFNKYHGKMT